MPHDEEKVPVDAIDQLCMMLAWEEDYSDEFKRTCLVNALKLTLPDTESDAQEKQ